MQKSLLVIGVSITLMGLLWPWLSKFPFGRLPGDIVIDRPGFQFYFPVSTMILISGFISLLVWFFRR